jgi:choline dehydrogenase
MNAMMFVCGTSQDYEGWKTSTGAAGWGWGTGANNDGMWAYYKKIMKMDDPALPSTCANYYGTTGPLYVTNSNSTSPMIPILQAAASQASYPLLADINCGKWIGLANVHATIKAKERNHAARAMLAPLWQRNNLMVMRGSQVTKINLVGTLGNNFYDNLFNVLNT